MFQDLAAPIRMDYFLKGWGHVYYNEENINIKPHYSLMEALTPKLFDDWYRFLAGTTHKGDGHPHRFLFGDAILTGGVW